MLAFSRELAQAAGITYPFDFEFTNEDLFLSPIEAFLHIYTGLSAKMYSFVLDLGFSCNMFSGDFYILWTILMPVSFYFYGFRTVSVFLTSKVLRFVYFDVSKSDQVSK